MSVARGLSLSVTLQARIEEAAERNANYVSSTTLTPPTLDTQRLQVLLGARERCSEAHAQGKGSRV